MPKKSPTPETRKPHTVWFENRMAEMGLDRHDAAKRWNTYPNMIWRVLTGARPVRTQEIIEWAEWLQIPVTVALYRFGFDVPRATVPVVGTVGKAGRVTVLPDARQTRIEAPNDLHADLVALRVEGTHAALAVFDGAHLYYAPSEIVRTDAFGRLSVVELGDYPAPLVGIVDRASVGKGRVTLFGGVDTIESEMMISAAPILWQKA